MVSPIQVPIMYLRAKQIFSKEKGIMRITGKPGDVAKTLAEKGYKLLHIIDLDAGTGTSPNFDVYNSLTHFINIQVESKKDVIDQEFLKKLVDVKARVIIKLPASFDLAKLSLSERLLVGKIDSNYDGDVAGVYDLIIENADDKTIEKFVKTKKRLIVSQDNYSKLKLKNQKLVWAVIES
ncbi:hypothetical protein KKF81_01445 [Candidatus Micrarchaeota archaeon]|nr:hypothetical protein [Candidatus Micrarchaeota archaeon]MBU1165583.1 hypothetical protein [Candidatus Micrarchaeota archaeon]MBU1887394.1 hypothetical protein [Candidatus Micrarchaeota archaeon]